METSDDRHDEHREGLDHDLPVLQDKGMVRRTWGRRGLLGLTGGIGAAALIAGCGNGSDPFVGRPPNGGGAGLAVSQDGLDDGDIPEETAGPYPGDGTNGPNVLTESGIVRSDITRSFGDATGVAEGVPLTISLKLYDNSSDGLAPYEGAAVYLWHCDREGRYSLYSDGVTEENYLRGVQVADAHGGVTFQSIYPACYSGRWPHLHFEVYESLDAATSAGTKLRTSQIAFPEDVCRTVYGDATGYDASLSNLEGVSLDTDGVFSDGHSLQMATLTGSVDQGYTLKLNVPV